MLGALQGSLGEVLDVHHRLGGLGAPPEPLPPALGPSAIVLLSLPRNSGIDKCSQPQDALNDCVDRLDHGFPLLAVRVECEGEFGCPVRPVVAFPVPQTYYSLRNGVFGLVCRDPPERD